MDIGGHWEEGWYSAWVFLVCFLWGVFVVFFRAFALFLTRESQDSDRFWVEGVGVCIGVGTPP